jgi:hypothetical protein
MVEFILIVWAIVIIITIGNIIRLNKFSKFLRAELNRVSHSRLADISNGNSFKAQWPNVIASYRNLKWYDIFNYDFESLMVYDDTY